MPDNRSKDNSKAVRARILRSRLQQIETWPQYSHYRELLKHRQSVKAWFNLPEAEYYKDFIRQAIVSFTQQLVDNYLDKDKNDLSAVIRGRLYQLKDVMGIVEEFDTYDKMRIELLSLENEGYVRGPEEGQAGTQIQ